jgi:type VI secretion system protein VasD
MGRSRVNWGSGMQLFRNLIYVGLSFVALSAAGCRSKPPKPAPPPPPAKATLVVSADVNPDVGGRAAPIVVRLYQLKEEGAFNSASYFALIDKEHETLGQSLVSREEFELRPASTRELELSIPPESRYLAAVAGFRDLNNSKWKALSPPADAGLLEFARKHKFTIRIGRSEVKITAAP